MSLSSQCTYTQCLHRLSMYWREGTKQAFQGLLDKGFDDTISKRPQSPLWPHSENELIESVLRSLSSGSTASLAISSLL